MPLIEVKAEIPAGEVDLVDDLLLERGDGRWSVLEDVPARRAWVVGIFEGRDEAGEAWALLAPELAAPGEVEIRELPDTDWRESYKAHFKAWRFGRLHWAPEWERGSRVLPEGDRVVWLDPGMAFGTGNHETTRLCVERLVAYPDHKYATARVVDAGCGSGILAISAAVLGFSDVSGFDNDPEAVAIARANAERNDVASRITFRTGDLESGFAGRQADLLLANIQADVLGRFVRELVSAVAPGGWLVLSGILASEVGRVREVFSDPGRGASIESRVLGEWADLLLRFPERS